MKETTPQSPDLDNTAAEPGVSGWRKDKVLWLIMGLAVFWGLAYNYAILYGLGPDELRHIKYVQLLVDEHRLPLILTHERDYAGAHGYHPPLYYVLSIPLFVMGRALFGEGGVHLMRLLSTALCVGALPFVYQLAFVGGGRDRNVARLSAAIFGALPIFGMFAGVVNNDGATLFTSVLFLWLLAVKYPGDTSLKSAVIIGLVFAAGALSKGSALLCNTAALVTYLYVQGGRKTIFNPQTWMRLATVIGMAIILAGPWYYRNHVLYGEWQPIPRGYTSAALPSPSNGILVMMMHDNFPAVLQFSLWGIFYSMWAQKDWIPEAIRMPIYLALLLFCLAAVAGNWKWAGRTVEIPADDKDVLAEKIACRCGYAAFIFTWFSCLFIALFVHFGQAEGGRYLIPAFSGAALFLARGWRGWLGSARLTALTYVWLVAFFAFNALCVYWLLAYLNPLYGPKG